MKCERKTVVIVSLTFGISEKKMRSTRSVHQVTVCLCNVWKQLKKESTETVIRIVSSLAIKMGGKHWFEWMSSFRKICWDFWKCILLFSVCFVLRIVNLNVSIRFCVIFCIYEHNKDVFFRFSEKQYFPLKPLRWDIRFSGLPSFILAFVMCTGSSPDCPTPRFSSSGAFDASKMLHFHCFLVFPARQ